jgi:hypothetical protein
MREHDVAALTAAELEAARRELAASLALARPGSLVRGTDPGPDGRYRRRTGRVGSRPVRFTRLPARPALERRARGLRRDAPTPRCRGVLVPGVGGLSGIPWTSGGGRGQMTCASSRAPAPSCTWIIWSAPSRLSIRATIGLGVRQDYVPAPRLKGAGRQHQGLYRVRVGERQPGQVDSQVPRVADELDCQRVAQLATLR